MTPFQRTIVFVAADYQTFAQDRPRFRLATYPTPLDRAPRLEEALREEGAIVPRIYLKRDDLLSLALGGNKVRNLEFSLGHALAEGATDVITSGRLQSNQCRLTAAACARAGLIAHLVFSGPEPRVATANQLLCRLLGARMYYAGSDDRAVREEYVRGAAMMLEGLGRHPYVIPVGGSDARGALGHALLAAELAQQCDAIAVRPVATVLATATGGTQAGLVAGLRKLRLDMPVVGFVVARSVADLQPHIIALSCDVAAAIGGDVSERDVRLDGSMLGGGYGVPTAEARAAIALLAIREGVLADPVYTGKALAGLLSMIRGGRFSPDDAVVFIHTGGAPALFA